MDLFDSPYIQNFSHVADAKVRKFDFFGQRGSEATIREACSVSFTAMNPGKRAKTTEHKHLNPKPQTPNRLQIVAGLNTLTDDEVELKN